MYACQSNSISRGTQKTTTTESLVCMCESVCFFTFYHGFPFSKFRPPFFSITQILIYFYFYDLIDWSCVDSLFVCLSVRLFTVNTIQCYNILYENFTDFFKTQKVDFGNRIHNYLMERGEHLRLN